MDIIWILAITNVENFMMNLTTDDIEGTNMKERGVARGIDTPA